MIKKRNVKYSALILGLGIVSACGQAEPPADTTPVSEQIEVDVPTAETPPPVEDVLLQRETWCNGVAVQSAEWLSCAQKT